MGAEEVGKLQRKVRDLKGLASRQGVDILWVREEDRVRTQGQLYCKVGAGRVTLDRRVWKYMPNKFGDCKNG